MDPSKILDNIISTDPTHIASTFSCPPKPGYSSKPSVPPPKPKDDNRSLQSILGFGPTGPSKSSDPTASPSKLQQELFDLILPASALSLPLPPEPPLPSLPSLPVKAETDLKPKTESSVSDFISDLFGDDSDSSNFLPSLTESQPFSTSVSDFSDILGDNSNFLPSFTQSQPFSTSSKSGPVKTEP